MKAKDSFKLAVNNITHRQLRSWLTLLGIIIGVAAVVSIVSIGEGAQASVNAQLSGLGADVITISPGYSRAGGFGGNFREGGFDIAGGGRTTTRSTSTTTKTPTLTKRDAQVILSDQNVKSVNEIVSGRGAVVFLAEKVNASIEGVNPLTWPDISSSTLAAGRFLTTSDASGIVIGDRVANSMFKQPITVGKQLIVEDKPFVVVGILKASGSGMGGGGSDGTIIMSQTSAWNVLSADINYGEYSTIQVKTISADVVEGTTATLTDMLLLSRKVNEKSQDFTITSALAIKEQVSSVTGTLTLFLSAIAAISLIVGAIGVANSMFTSVLEKTKQIGILKALGAKNNEVLMIFLFESGLFGFFGGVIGVIIGWIASLGMSSIGIIAIPGARGGTMTLVTPELVIVAILLSTVVGILSGIMPARAASKLRPVEALRYE
ncbi:MacB-like periplasmic core domain protein [uncultured archaeon]|nr:MacB-like periplasmic core domain protein [uncultured archaeon]